MSPARQLVIICTLLFQLLCSNSFSLSFSFFFFLSFSPPPSLPLSLLCLSFFCTLPLSPSLSLPQSNKVPVVQHPHHVHPLTPLITYSNEHFSPGTPPSHLSPEILDPKTGMQLSSSLLFSVLTSQSSVSVTPTQNVKQNECPVQCTFLKQSAIWGNHKECAELHASPYPYIVNHYTAKYSLLLLKTPIMGGYV